MNRRTLLGSIAALVAWPFARRAESKTDSVTQISLEHDNWVLCYPIKSKVTQAPFMEARAMLNHINSGQMTALQVAALIELWNRTDGAQSWKLLPYRKCTSHPTDWTRLYGEPHLSTLDHEHLQLFIHGFRDSTRPRNKPPQDHINGVTQ